MVLELLPSNEKCLNEAEFGDSDRVPILKQESTGLKWVTLAQDLDFEPFLMLLLGLVVDQNLRDGLISCS